MRETARRGLLALLLIAILGGLVYARTQADVRDMRQDILEAYIASPIPEGDYDLAEEIIVAEITEVLTGEEVSVTPSVKFELIPHLYLLVISERGRINIIHYALFQKALSLEKMNEIELGASISEQVGDWECELGCSIIEPQQSAVVVRIGGVATNPPSVVSSNLATVVHIATHEWGHEYLRLYPLGQHYTSDSDIAMLNEMVADTVAEEILEALFHKYGWEAPTKAKGGCTREELRPVRIAVDQLLAEGKIDEAEAYMEEARQRLCSEGWCPRKLNQAFFAFCERYGGGAAGDSPIPSMFKELRAQYPSLREFLEEMRVVSSHEDFLSLLEEKEINYPEG